MTDEELAAGRALVEAIRSGKYTIAETGGARSSSQRGWERHWPAAFPFDNDIARMVRHETFADDAA